MKSHQQVADELSRLRKCTNASEKLAYGAELALAWVLDERSVLDPAGAPAAPTDACIALAGAGDELEE